MGFKKNWDTNEVNRQISAAGWQVCSPHNDGFTAFFAKQDLYQIYWHLGDVLRKCPKFSGEDEWLREQEKKQVINILKDEM